MSVLASGMITLIDVYDAKSVSAWISASQVTVQTFDKANGSYNPNYSTTPQVLTLNLTEAGSNESLIGANVSNVKWFKLVGNARTEITSTSSATNEFKSGTSSSILTTKLNIPETANLISYVVEGTWTDTDSEQSVNFSTKIDLTLIQLAKATIIGNIYTPSGDLFRNKTPNNLKVNADLYKDGNLSTGSKRFKWFRADSNVLVSEDADAGLGWKKITATTGTTGAVVSTGFNVATTSQGVLTVYPDAVTNNQTFMCIIIDNSGSTTGTMVKQYITLRDMDDPITVVIESTGGDKVMTNEGTNVLTARLYRLGIEIDEDGTTYTYKWYKWENNQLIPNFGGSGIGYKTGKSLAVPNIDIRSSTNFKLEVEE